ncbi:MAG: ATP-binding protein [Bacteroidales bacterium]|nr:ATP-binding protein [Bacteroidales bacterium]
MKRSPFIYGNTVSLESFTNREEETKKLYNNLVNGINTSIISPRRWGKSSLVEKVISDINNQESGFKTVVIDLFSVSCEEEFLETFAREVIKASSSKFQDWINSSKYFFKHIIPQISIGVDPTTDFSLSFNWNEIKKHSTEILNLPEVIAEKKAINFIVCLDEFQNLSGFKDYENLEKKMRSVWQRHKNVTYCLYGSKRHMMSEIFNNPSKPFYRFGDIVILKKIRKEKWIDFIINGFKKTGKSISEEFATLIPELMENHSWYVQQLSHYTWNNTNKVVSRNDIDFALNELLRANSPLYQQQIEIISTTQLNLLKAVLSGETQLTSSNVMSKYKLGTPNNVNKNKTRLVNDDIIQEHEGLFEFVDPAFKIWFKTHTY